ncbi:MAG: Gfo/Idh/MocA family oxidoreductase [Planctomycetota bacterium]|nr:Gfo/Idh/MocA family oxidoreductase [Planctomycetota bacterium]
MPVRVGLVGLGMMGTTHFKSYQEIPGAEVVAVCDVEGRKLSGDWSKAAGNIDTGAAKQVDLSRLRTYSDFAAILADPEIDLVDLCVPTHQHAEMTMQALAAGKHVFCEKPMARSSKLAREMIRAAKKAGRLLAVGHVLRFWPEYLLMKDLIDSSRYGRVRSAHFVRLSPRPQWSWNNWLQDAERSGAAALDLHIHDTDTVQWFFGRPAKVASAGTLEGGGIAHIVTDYRYEGGPLVVAEGGWSFPTSFPFRMEARIQFESAALEYSSLRSPTVAIYDDKTDKVEHPPIPAAFGYTEELRYFVGCVAAGTPPAHLSPADSAAAVAIVEAEIKSARSGRAVKVVL